MVRDANNVSISFADVSEEARRRAMLGRGRLGPPTSTTAGLTTGFVGFKASRFDLPGATNQPLWQWLAELPLRDPRHRFSTESIRSLLDRLEAKVREAKDADGWYQPHSVLERVVAANLKQHSDLPETLKEDITRLALSPLGDEHTLALLLYTAELYDPATGKPCEYQLYSELNRICREYGHTDSVSRELQADWELFLPFSGHLQAAVHALPPVPMVLYRGAGHSINAKDYECNTRGSWGGFVSASSDRRQAVGFVSRDTGLQSVSGSYFLIITDEARPIYHLSEFPEEMEYLHPLGEEFETCCVIPAFMLSLASVNVNVVTMKRAGSKLSLELHIRQQACVAYIFENLYQKYVVPCVTTEPQGAPLIPVGIELDKFLDGPNDTLLVTGPQGVGKTLFAAWLSFQREYNGWIFIFLCVARVPDPLAPNAILEALRLQHGYQDGTLEELRARRVVLVMDNFFGDPQGRPFVYQSNGFASWNLKLLLVCRPKMFGLYRHWAGPCTSQWFLQPFSDDQIEEYIALRSSGVERAVSRGESSGVRLLSGGTIRRQSTAPGPTSEALLQTLRASPLWPHFGMPSVLCMAIDLYLEDRGALCPINNVRQLHLTWLEWYLALRGSQDIAADVQKAEEVAWEMQKAVGCYAIVGDRAKHEWLRRLPLLVASYNPDGIFTYASHSLREVLVAQYLWRRLTADTPDRDSELGQASVKMDLAILKWFQELYHLPENAALQTEVQQRLLSAIYNGARRTTAATSHLTSNSIALLGTVTRTATMKPIIKAR